MAEAAVLDGVSAPPPAAISARQVTAAVVGNALEFYDFLIFTFFAVQIGHTFFPGHSEFFSLMASLITFGAGFVCRPIGAVLIGRYGDIVGRRPAMVFTLALMGGSILGLALTPSYAAIGPFAPVLVVIWRLTQGFALGGEVGPTTAFLVEASPVGRRGFYAGWQGASQNLASMAGSLVGVALAAAMGAAALEAWGWRVAFLVGALSLPFGLLIRRGLPETLHHPEPAQAALPAQADPGDHLRIAVLGVGLILAATVSTYVTSFMTTYAITTLHMPVGVSLAAPLAAGGAGLVSGLASGAMSDRWGRRPFMIWPRVVLALVVYPAFVLIVRNHDAVTLLSACAVMAFIGGFSAPALVAVAESLHKAVRGTGIAAIYAVSVAVFGGTTQPMIAWLIHATHNPLAPAWYMAGANVIGVAAAVLMRETAPALTQAADG